MTRRRVLRAISGTSVPSGAGAQSGANWEATFQRPPMVSDATVAKLAASRPTEPQVIQRAGIGPAVRHAEPLHATTGPCLGDRFADGRSEGTDDRVVFHRQDHLELRAVRPTASLSKGSPWARGGLRRSPRPMRGCPAASRAQLVPIPVPMKPTSVPSRNSLVAPTTNSREGSIICGTWPRRPRR